MSFWGWCLALLVIVGGLVGIVYVLWQVAKVPLLLLLDAWENRSGLNPRTSPGRWRLAIRTYFAALCASSRPPFTDSIRVRGHLSHYTI
jgi:hypothetical protein